MRKVGVRKLTAKIIHPNDADIYVEARWMPTAEALDYFGDIATRGKTEAVIDPATGKPLRDSKGSVVTITKQRFNAKTVIEFLERVITGFGGITDEDGATLQFSKEAITNLLDESLDVLLDQPDDDGNLTKPWWKHIMDEAGKKENFDRDPKAKSSDSK